MSLPQKRSRVILPALGAQPSSGSLPSTLVTAAAVAAAQQPSASGRGSGGGVSSDDSGNDPSAGSRNQSVDSSADPKPRAVSKRQVVAVACHSCRRRKAKCDGQRPKCQHCSKRGVECHYEANQGETVSLALKRKANDLETENTQYRDLFRMVCTKSGDEAKEIFRRIRFSGDPIRVLESIRQAEILLSLPTTNDRTLLEVGQDE
ncbi:Putative zn(2)Cys(6) fungal-type DNA-binding domain-containing protein [Colletotrichum destructivum]|uniref:Zn(2)Cys(6) fungal-type DNA-binding domain-containing protein n=1 Tax=Colletotrichum destructivum TaxID=34406 RepID=A0AAX4HZK2_9PEZI|nr:Putative zn(2)Cys(6) fungal-type DNA-binding domain-containing protein [Colletotrichum destructivum]